MAAPTVSTARADRKGAGRMIRALAASSLVRALVGVGGLLLIWEIAARASDVSSLVLPPPTEVLAGLAEVFAEGELVPATGLSILRVLTGIALGVGLAFLIGIPVGWYPRLFRMVDPLIQMLRPIPPLAWIPLSIIWFGVGMKGIVFVIFLGAFFPTVVNTIDAVRATNRDQLELAQVLGLRTGPSLIRRVAIPAALPMSVNGMRIGIGLGWMCVVTAEMVSATQGLGFMIHRARFEQATEVIIGGMLLIGLLGLGTDILVRRLERRLFGWRRGLTVGG